MTTEQLYSGRFLEMVSVDGWEYVRRQNTTGVVAIVPVTADRELVLVEQYRPPIDASLIELPAGLAGDIEGHEDEQLVLAAQRELYEETGFEAGAWIELGTGPSSAGLTDEQITFFAATQLERKGEGGGDGSESITVHIVKLEELKSWIKQREQRGLIIDPKIYAGLWLAQMSGLL